MAVGGWFVCCVYVCVQPRAPLHAPRAPTAPHPPPPRPAPPSSPRARSIGGLWAQLPRWQTVQNDPIDFCTEGFTTRKAVWDADDVCHMLEQKALVQGLGPRIRLGHRLEGYTWAEEGQHWVCQVGLWFGAGRGGGGWGRRGEGRVCWPGEGAVGALRLAWAAEAAPP